MASVYNSPSYLEGVRFLGLCTPHFVNPVETSTVAEKALGKGKSVKITRSGLVSDGRGGGMGCLERT